MRPRQTHRIPPLLLGKLEANSDFTGAHFPIRTTKLHLISFTGAHWKMRTSKWHLTLSKRLQLALIYYITM